MIVTYDILQIYMSGYCYDISVQVINWLLLSVNTVDLYAQLQKIHYMNEVFIHN